MSETRLTNLERTRIEMAYAVPLIRDLQRLLGEDAVNDALARRFDDQIEKSAKPGEKADFSRMEAGTATFAEGGALDYEIIGSDAEHFDLNITGCRYAEMMDEMGARDIGHLLICNRDYPAAAKIGMSLTRTQTRMQGAGFCDFRYRRRG